jgi:hypothetical protein
MMKVIDRNTGKREERREFLRAEFLTRESFALLIKISLVCQLGCMSDFLP